MKKGYIALLLLISTMLLVGCNAQSNTEDANKTEKTERYGDKIKEKTKTSANTIKANIDTDLPSGMLFEISAKSEDGTTLEKQTGEVGVLGGIKGTFENVKPDKYTLTYSTLPLEKQSEKVQEKIKEADKTFDGQFIKKGVLNKVEIVTLPESDRELAEDDDSGNTSFKDEAEQGSKKYPATAGEILFNNDTINVTGQKYHFSGEVIQKLQVDSEAAWLVKNDAGYVMPVFAEDFDAAVGDNVEIWGTLTGDGYQASDFKVDNIVGMTGSMRIVQLNINGKEIQ
ncbi:TPA_asm: hypothetical protein GHH72_01165 [Listeria monocytogenes]|nr:hypothetical protein [Listeria monocytogenes]HDU7438239.1 hypothetical protein [Listeria monocytogenes]